MDLNKFMLWTPLISLGHPSLTVDIHDVTLAFADMQATCEAREHRHLLFDIFHWTLHSRKQSLVCIPPLNTTQDKPRARGWTVFSNGDKHPAIESAATVNRCGEST